MASVTGIGENLRCGFAGIEVRLCLRRHDRHCDRSANRPPHDSIDSRHPDPPLPPSPRAGSHALLRIFGQKRMRLPPCHVRSPSRSPRRAIRLRCRRARTLF
jgi:hypothetical protein